MSLTATEAPPARRWPCKYAGMVEAVNGADIDPSGRTDLLKVLDRAKRDGILPAEGDAEQAALMECDCDALRVFQFADASPVADLFAVIPLHQLASIGFVHEPPLNILALKVGDVEDGAPDLFDLVVLFVPTEFIYREAVSALEEEQHDVTSGKCNSDELLAAKFLPAIASSASSLCSVSASSPSAASHFHQAPENGCSNRKSLLAANSSTTSDTTATSTKQTVELVNEYLTMLSACLSHDELNKFAILMRRWRVREMPILEFAQKLLELYGPERRHLLARMRTLLRGDPSELEALTDFLRANGVVENAAAGGSPLRTTEMSLGEGSGGSSKGTTSSCPPSALLISSTNSPPPEIEHRRPNSS